MHGSISCTKTKTLLLRHITICLARQNAHATAYPSLVIYI